MSWLVGCDDTRIMRGKRNRVIPIVNPQTAGGGYRTKDLEANLARHKQEFRRVKTDL